jgi:hypothetical protein
MHGPATTALATTQTRLHPGEDHVISGLRRRHAGPDGIDNARALVAHDDRRRDRGQAALDREIAVTHTAGGELDANLARARVRQLHRLDGEWLLEAPQNGCLHVILPGVSMPPASHPTGMSV